jgi:hypothetical protein
VRHGKLGQLFAISEYAKLGFTAQHLSPADDLPAGPKPA